eukprot:7338823-Pyramimonas_sp.AAC.1
MSFDNSNKAKCGSAERFVTSAPGLSAQNLGALHSSTPGEAPASRRHFASAARSNVSGVPWH